MKKHIVYPKEKREIALKASAIYRTQQHRCTSTNSSAYTRYGMRGICVEYSRQEFVNWYLENSKNVETKNIVVGRIDHDSNYSLSNIRIETKSFSSNEMLERTGWRREIAIVDDSTKEIIAYAVSQKEAAKLTETNFKTINSQLINPPKNFNRKKTKTGFRFYYKE